MHSSPRSARYSNAVNCRSRDIFALLFPLGIYLAACNGDSSADDESASSSASETGSTTIGTTTAATESTMTEGGSESGASNSASTTGPTTATTSSTSSTEGSTTALTSTTGTSTQGESESSTGGLNEPPMIDSDPIVELQLQELLGGKFDPDQLFLASSVTKEIRVYEASTLAFLQSFDHPLFAETSYNPRGMAFNERGNLVVATYTTFIEFSGYGEVYATYTKEDPEATENVIFDALGNMYTTTATGGTDRLNQYAAEDYSFIKTIAGPVGAGQFTGITFDDENRLFLASQSDNKIHIAQANEDFTTFSWTKSLPGSGPSVRLEGLVFNRTGELIVAQADLLRYDLQTDTIVGSFDVLQDVWPVPVSVDNKGNIYTADFENGSGSLSADIVRFDQLGKNSLTINDPDLFGPFGLAISGTVLASDPPVLYSYQVTAKDPDGDTLTYSLLKSPPDMTIDSDTGLIEWLVTSKDLGSYEIIVEVADGMGGTDQQMFTLEITAG